MPAAQTSKRADYQPPRLLAWQEQALQQGQFDWAVPMFAWVPTSQAAKVLHLSVKSVLNLIELGKLEVEVKCITGGREEYNVSRRSILLYRAANSRLEPRDMLALWVDALGAIKCPQLLAAVAEAAARELKRRTS